jgi:hypothetical protein
VQQASWAGRPNALSAGHRRWDAIDEVAEATLIADDAFQSLYHFTVGGAVEDTRLVTLPPYGHLGVTSAPRG